MIATLPVPPWPLGTPPKRYLLLHPQGRYADLAQRIVAGIPREPCTAETSRCGDARDYRVDLPACCRAHVRTIMQRMGELMDAEGMTWWVDYGSLLGLVRNPLLGLPPGIVAHDKDGDCGVLGAEWDRFLALEPKVRAMGLDWLHKPTRGRGEFGAGHSVKVRLSATNHTNVDYFPWYERGGQMHRLAYIGADRFKGREFPADRLLPVQRVEWEGITVSAPADPEWFVAHRYGPNWRIPVRANNDGVRR